MDQAQAVRLASPEQLNDYLRVTNPKIWVLLVAVILLLGSLLVWSNFTVVESYAAATVEAKGGDLSISFDNQDKAAKVQPGMVLEVGNVNAEILRVESDSRGNTVAYALANIPDGTYDAKVGYDTLQVISMLLN